MNVRTSGTGPVSTVTVRAPARSNAAASSRAAARHPVVAPTETMRTSVARSGPGTATAAQTWRADREEGEPLSSIRLVRKPGVRTSWIGRSGDVRST